MDRKTEFIEVDLVQLFQAIWHRAWLVLLAMLGAGVLALGAAKFLITPMYQAQILVYINNNSDYNGQQMAISPSELSAAKSLVDTYAVILKTRQTLGDVIEQAQLPYTYEELYQMVDAASVNSTEIFYIEVTSPEPEEAALIANTIGEILPEKISAVVDGSAVRIVDDAVIPRVPSSPNLKITLIVGILLGAILSCGIIVIRELTDQQIHDSDDLTQTYDLPVLARIPDLFDNTKPPSGKRQPGGKTE